MSDAPEIPIAVLQQYFRVPVGALAVDYHGRPPLLGSTITNISTTGVFVQTARPLPVGTAVAIRFTLPGPSGSGGTGGEVKADTVVRWSTAEHGPPPGTPAGMGLTFTALPTAGRRRVERHVAAFLARMRRG